MVRFVALVLLISVAACSGEEAPEREPACVPNESRSCSCPDGRLGAQVCDEEGASFSSCECLSIPSMPDAGMTPIPPPPPPPPPPSDAGVQQPYCGDGVCAANESCSACETDCGPCPVACSSCEEGRSCPSGTECAWRGCDGALSCYEINNDRAICTTVDQNECPPVSHYERATQPSDCSPYAPYNALIGRCWPTCGRSIAGFRSNQCPPPPADTVGVTAGCFEIYPCEQPSHGPGVNCGPFCYLACEAGARCPAGLTCQEGQCL